MGFFVVALAAIGVIGDPAIVLILAAAVGWTGWQCSRRLRGLPKLKLADQLTERFTAKSAGVGTWGALELWLLLAWLIVVLFAPNVISIPLFIAGLAGLGYRGVRRLQGNPVRTPSDLLGEFIPRGRLGPTTRPPAQPRPGSSSFTSA